MHKKLEIKYLKPEQITPYINNSRTHSDEQIQQVKASIAEFGMCTPIGLHNGVIVYGHARFKALCELGHKEIPTVDLSHLSEAQRKAYVLADNQLAMNAGWDNDLLKIELQELGELDFDLDLLGFDDALLDELLSEPNFDPATEDDQGDLSNIDPKLVCCPYCNKDFDLNANG